MADSSPKLVWSYARKRCFDNCRREYYYRYYSARNGWSDEATPEQRLAYRLKHLQSLPVLTGTLVHESIRDTLRRYRNANELIGLDQALQVARQRFERHLFENASGRWRRDPKRHLCLTESYFGDEHLKAKVDDAWDNVETALFNFHTSPTWLKLSATKPSRWLAVDGSNFAHTLIGGVPAFGKPDLGYAVGHESSPNRHCWIFDWKTGKPREEDRTQLRHYALYAASEWNYPQDAISAWLIYLLPNLKEEKVTFEAGELAQARIDMQESFTRMQSVMSDPDAGEPLPVEHFPVTTDAKKCRFCSFRELCPEQEEPTLDLDD